MKNYSGRLGRWLALGVLCLAVTALAAGVFVFTASGGSDLMVYLPVVAGPAAETGGGALENGGTVDGPDGVGIGALTDTLAEPIVVNIARTEAPTTALPSMAQVVSEYYLIGAEEDVFVASERPLLVAFPVPAGADTAHLALAALSSGEEVNDVDANLQAWSFLEGMYDADQNLFLTTVAGLTDEGRTYVLTTHRDFDSPNNASTAMGPSSPQIGPFRAKCVHFTDPSDCTPAMEIAVKDFLVEAYEHIQQAKGFEEPRLMYLHETLQYNPNALSSLGYTVYIEPHDYGYCKSLNAAGHYGAHNGLLALCLKPGGLNDGSYLTLVHEYFHATQAGYTPVLADWLNGTKEAWIIEGMATSAKESYNSGELWRTESSGWEKLHKVDKSMKSEEGLDAYFAQDFWVFYGQDNSQDMSYLQQVLSSGAKSEDVVGALGDGERLKAYWDWAKNQVMEKEVTFDNELQNPCHVEEQMVEEFEIFEHDYPDKSEHMVTVGPLSTAVVKLTFSHSYGYVYGLVEPHLVAQLPDAEHALEYKFYEDGESGCEGVPDGPREWPWGEGVEAGKVYYIVISNTDYDNTFDYAIYFELGG